MQPQSPSVAGREPILNLPAVVASCVAVLVIIHALRSFVLTPQADLELVLEFAVVPARWTVAWNHAAATEILNAAVAGLSGAQAAAREALAQYILADNEARPWTALSYALFHGSWSHVLLNSVWLAAFGTPVARRCGALRFLMLGALAAAAGAAAHVLVHPLSVVPMIGASAAVSGWMAAAAQFVFAPAPSDSFRLQAVQDTHDRHRQPWRELLRNRAAVIFLAIWFATNLIFGILAAPLGIVDSSVAWEAHIGGFAAGLILFPWFDRR